MLSSRLHQLAQIGVVLSTTGLVMLSVATFPGEGTHRPDPTEGEESSERNERSTPRTFVLPATPAVALTIEEREQSYAANDPPIECILALKHGGFLSTTQEQFVDSAVIEAVYRFQGATKLPQSGRLDKATKRQLKCE